MRRVEGLALVTLAVPFTMLVDDDAPTSGEQLTAWLNWSFDRLEGIEMVTANADDHEVVDFTIDDAWRDTDEQ